MLAGIVLGAFLLRFLTLREIPFPPSGDAAGDLVWVHTYLGHPLPGYTLLEAPPPVYILGVVWPATSGLGTFTGIQFIMALVPALLAVPGYFLLRELRCGVAASLGGAALLATSADISLMIAWNSAFNATGILFLTAFLAVLARGLQRPTRLTFLAAGVLLAIVAGTHVVTLLYGLVVLVALAVEILVLRPSDLRKRLGFLGRTVAVGAVASIPFWAAYYDSYVITSNVGPPSQASGLLELLFTYSQSLSLPWGSNSPASTPDLLGFITLLDMLATAVALFWIWQGPEHRNAAVLSGALFFGAVFIAALDPGNSIRAVYFLPLAYVPALAAAADRVGRPRAASPPHGSEDPDPVRRWHLDPPARRGALAVFGVAFIAANVVVSQQVLFQAETFYQLLSPAKLATLDWMRSDTSPNAVFYDGANLQTWIPGYADRLSYAPTPLASRITQISYDRAFDANLIDLGGYVLGDARLYVTSNAPGVYNSPGIFLRTSDFNLPIWLGESDTTHVTVSGPHGASTVLLDYGESIQVTGGVAPNGSAYLSIFSAFPPQSVDLWENFSLTGGSIRVGFAADPGAVTNVSMDLRTPPSGYYYDYAAFASGPRTGSVGQSLQVPDIGTVGVRTTGPSFSAVVATESSGWSTLNLTATDGWTLTVTGWGGAPGATPFFEPTLALAEQLGIQYFVVSDLSDYPLYERLFALASQGYVALPVVFTSGAISVFELS